MSTAELLSADIGALGRGESPGLRFGRFEGINQAMETVFSRLRAWENNRMPLLESFARSFRKGKYVGELEQVGRVMDLVNNGEPLSGVEAEAVQRDLEQYGLKKEEIDDLLVIGRSSETNERVLGSVGRLIRKQQLAIGDVPPEMKQKLEAVLGQVNRFALAAAAQAQGGSELLPSLPGLKKPEKARKKSGYQRNWWSGAPGGGCALLVFLCCSSLLLSTKIGEGWSRVSAWNEENKLTDAGEWERAEALRLHGEYPDVTYASVDSADVRLKNVLTGIEPSSNQLVDFDVGTFLRAGSEESGRLSGRQLSMALGWHDALVDAGLINEDGRLDVSEQNKVIDKLKQLGVSPEVAGLFWQKFSWAYDRFDDYGVETNRDKIGIEQQQQQQVMAEVRLSSSRSKQQEMMRRGVGRKSIADTGLGHRGPRRS